MEANGTIEVGRSGQALTVFVSSGDDAVELRDRVETIASVFNQQLYQAGVSLWINVDRWEHTPAQKAPSGHVNDLFVERALRSDLTLVLLIGRLGPGTKEEIDAVKHRAKPDLAILWFKPESGEIEDDLRKFIEAMKNELFLQELGPADGEDGWTELFRVLLRLVFRVARV